nr:MAG TPA: helix-turn-helix domain protein [Caudoviricetes sp.]
MSVKVGKQIKKRRIELSLSQLQLAEKCGYKTKGSISRIEKGETDLNQEQIMLFAKVLDTTPSYIMGWVDDPSCKSLKEINSNTINEFETKLLDKYRSSPENIKKAVNAILEV